MTDCLNCGASTHHVCYKCRLPYCSVDCQQVDWVNHKGICAAVAWIGAGEKRQREDEGDAGQKRTKRESALELFVQTQHDAAKELLKNVSADDLMSLCAASRVIFDFCVKWEILQKRGPQNPIAGLTVAKRLGSVRLTKYYLMWLKEDDEWGFRDKLVTFSLYGAMILEGETVSLLKAIYAGDAVAVKLLLAKVAPTASDFIKAIQSESAGIVELLLNDPRVDPGANNNSAIRWAAEHGHLKVVELLLADERVDPSASNNYAIRWAVKYGHLEVVKLLLSDERVDPSAENNSALEAAVRENHIKIVKILLRDPRVGITSNVIKQSVRLLYTAKLLLDDPRSDISMFNFDHIRDKRFLRLVIAHPRTPMSVYDRLITRKI